MKHAYLILAHNEFEVLNKLIEALDDERNDIYIHFDAKIKKVPLVSVKHAGLHILTNRTDVRWGDISVVEAELKLFEEAYHNKEKYEFYHLLSGVDIPLKSQDEIHDFFHRHCNREFIGFYQDDIQAAIERKIQHYHLFPKHFKPENKFLKDFFIRTIRALFLRLQFMVGYKRNWWISFRKGTQWVSLTTNFVKYLLKQKRRILRTYHHTFCSDEVFIQTVCYNSPFYPSLFDEKDEARGCMRKIGWKDNQIKEWEEKDFDELMHSEEMFARKFSSRHMEVVNRILERISK